MITARYRHLEPLAFASLLAAFAACVGDDPAGAVAPGADAGSDSPTSSGVDAAPPSADDGGGDAASGAVISGKVVYEYSNVPGAVVVIQGKSATTAANGTFSLAGITLPYDVSVVLPPALALTGVTGASLVSTYMGLSTSSPVLHAYAKVTPSQATFTGAVNGGSASSSSRYQIIVSAPLSAGISGLSGGESAHPPKSYAVTTLWPAGQSTQNVTLIALEYTMPSAASLYTGIPIAYTYMATAIASVQSGSTNPDRLGSFVDVSMSSGTVSGTITIPDGYTQRRRMLRLQPAESGEYYFDESSEAPQFSYAVPKEAHLAKIVVGATAAKATGEYASAYKVVAADDTGIAIEVAKAADFGAPADNATGVHMGSTLSWSAVGPECVYGVYLASPADGSTQFSFRTTATSVTIPDLSAQSAALTAASSYDWYVSCSQQQAATASIDAEATLAGAFHTGDATTPHRKFVSQ